MSEIVARKLQESLYLIEHLKASNIFTEKEIRKIISKREDNLNKITSNHSKESYNKYITDELKIIEKLKTERKNRNINSLAHLLSKELYKVCIEALDRYKNDMNFWFEIITLGTKLGRGMTLMPYIDKMIKLHFKQPDVYLYSSVWCWNRKQFNIARDILFKGIENLPDDSFSLYKTLFRLELKDKFSQNNEGAALLIFEDLINKLSKTDFSEIKKLFDFIPESYKNKIELNKKLAEKIKIKFPDHYEKFQLESKLDLIKTISNELSIDKDVKIFEKLNNVKHISKLMWPMFLKETYLLSNEYNDFKLKIFQKAFEFETKSSCCLMDQSYAELYTDLLITSTADANEEVYEYFLDKYENSAKIWCNYLAFMIYDKRTEKQLLKFFEKANQVLRINALNLWKLMEKYYEELSKEDVDYKNKFELFYVDAILQPYDNISSYFTKKFFDYLHENNENDKLNNYMKKFELERPTAELYNIFLSLINDNCLKEKVLTRAICKFGSSQVKFWLDFIELYKNNKRPDKVSEIYFQGLLNLNDANLRQQLRTDFKKLM